MRPAALARRPEAWAFAIVLASAAFYWQGRDWNTASRLMLTYAMGDRGTIRLDGLDRQTGDIARFRDHFYTDKQPGYSALALPTYLAAKRAFGLPDHPIDRDGFAYWPADYPNTLGVSGLATAILAALLAHLAGRLGCGPRASALVGLSYGLATPAAVYATLAYGHQATALALVASAALIARGPGLWGALAAGFLAGLAPAVELQVAPVSALLGLWLVVRIVCKSTNILSLLLFLVAGAIPVASVLAYNVAAFGSAFDMGYFHHATPRFAEVHSARNPLGLRTPDMGKAAALLVGPYRGLLTYAPILILAVPGWIVMAGRPRDRGLASVSTLACLLVFGVNLSYPEWTGGWSTGPRLLLPMIPFGMIGVAGLLSAETRRAWSIAGAIALTIAGAVLMSLFLGVGGRLPDRVYDVPLTDPLRTAVWPLWRGDPLPPWWIGERFTRTIVTWAVPDLPRRLPASWAWLAFAPLWVFQGVAVLAMLRSLRLRTSAAPGPAPLPTPTASGPPPLPRPDRA